MGLDHLQRPGAGRDEAAVPHETRMQKWTKKLGRKVDGTTKPERKRKSKGRCRRGKYRREEQRRERMSVFEMGKIMFRYTSPINPCLARRTARSASQSVEFQLRSMTGRQIFIFVVAGKIQIVDPDEKTTTKICVKHRLDKDTLASCRPPNHWYFQSVSTEQPISAEIAGIHPLYS
ncbi:hypothetical protein BJ165DRAFT_1403539 [Panaeolus papilionaceus]|nr:hypothetical protein BJ165DRAFT_1403539 [Panaeolus papilionaceus]